MEHFRVLRQLLMLIHKKETKWITREMYFLKSPFLFNTTHQNEENTAFFIIWYSHSHVHPAWISISDTSVICLEHHQCSTGNTQGVCLACALISPQFSPNEKNRDYGPCVKSLVKTLKCSLTIFCFLF